MNRSHLTAWVLTISSLSALCAEPLVAQVIPDNTLPVGERSQVTGNPTVQINGGARRGGNLFHSFSQFSIPTGGFAYFNNAADVQNIFSRVTGGSISNIDGVIRANGTANLFLLNPNGILFGPNASLNIGGSFVATTANAIGFSNGEKFSSDATQPLPSQLLTVNPNALFFSQLTAQAIINRSTANNGTGLQVPAGQSLLLVGGNVQLEGGQIVSPGSRVELGAVAGPGIVGLSGTVDDWRLSFLDSVARADVSLSNSAVINVLAGGGGSIAITARNVTLSEGSRLQAGIGQGLGVAGTQAGDIQLDATDRINVAANNRIRNDVEPDGTGNAGNINITTRSLAFTGSAQVASTTSGQGNGGSLNINARETVAWDGETADSDASGTSVGFTGIGNAGNINITTGSLFLTGGGQLLSATSGQGNAGNINIHARDTISVNDSSIRNASFNGSDRVNFLRSTGVGSVGNINITTGSLFLTGGLSLASVTVAQGDAGSVNINARDRVSVHNSGVLNFATSSDVRKAAEINVTAGSLSLTGGAQLIANTLGGKAGRVNIKVRDTVSIDGADSDGTPSGIFANVVSAGVGPGGDLSITAGSFSLTNGATLSAITTGQGDAGNIVIRAAQVAIAGSLPTSGLPGGLFTSSDTTGNAGDIIIETQGLRLADGAVLNARSRGDGRGGDIKVAAARSFEAVNGGQLITTTFGQGQAGSITVEAGERVTIAGSDPNYAVRLTKFSKPIASVNAVPETGPASGFFANTQPNSSGRGGDIQIATGQLTVQAGGQLLSSTASSGRAGDIMVQTPDLQLSGATSGLFANTISTGNAGNLTIQPRGNEQSVRVELQDGAQISASTSSSGRGGELTIAAPASITLTGNGSVIAAGTGGSGAGGNLNLVTGTLNIQNRAEVTVSSTGTGIAGSLFVEADRIYLSNQGSIRADTTGGGGNINLRSLFILLRNGSNITTNATGSDILGGNIAIDTRFLIAVTNEDSNVSANSEDFRGGNVNINAFAIYGIQPRPTSTPLSDITATGATAALGGTIDVITAGVDPTSGLVALPTELVDSSGLIAQGCPANKGNSFVITGRGGLPPTPEQQLDDDAEWSDRRRLFVTRQIDGGGGRRQASQSISRREFAVSLNSELKAQNIPYPSGSQSYGNASRFWDAKGYTELKTFPNTRHPTPDPPIIEATGWQATPNGDIFLVATTPDPMVQNRLNQAATCQGR